MSFPTQYNRINLQLIIVIIISSNANFVDVEFQDAYI